jgi:hypothetical protein
MSMSPSDVYAILDQTHPNWRKELDPEKFESIAAYEAAMEKALNEGLEKLKSKS